MGSGDEGGGLTGCVCEVCVDFFFAAFVEADKFLLEETGCLEVIFVVPWKSDTFPKRKGQRFRRGGGG